MASKKFIALVLIIVMVWSIMPIGSLADGGDVLFTIEAPSTVAVNEEFTVKVKLSSTNDTGFNGFSFKVSYDSVFSYVSHEVSYPSGMNGSGYNTAAKVLEAGAVSNTTYSGYVLTLKLKATTAYTGTQSISIEEATYTKTIITSGANGNIGNPASVAISTVPASLSLNPSSVSMTRGSNEATTISAVLSPEYATASIQWGIADPSLFSATSSNATSLMLTPATDKSGNTTVHATATNGSTVLTATCAVNVAPGNT